MVFISRQQKASWGLPCNQKADGTLWAGKGYEKKLEGQFGSKEAVAIKKGYKLGQGQSLRAILGRPRNSQGNHGGRRVQ